MGSPPGPCQRTTRRSARRKTANWRENWERDWKPAPGLQETISGSVARPERRNQAGPVRPRQSRVQFHGPGSSTVTARVGTASRHGRV